MTCSAISQFGYPPERLMSSQSASIKTDPWQPAGAGSCEQSLNGQMLPSELHARTPMYRLDRATGASAGQSAANPCPQSAGQTIADAHEATNPETPPDPRANEARLSRRTSSGAGAAPDPSEKCAQRTVASGQPHTAGPGAAPAYARGLPQTRAISGPATL